MQLTFAGGFYQGRGIIADTERCVNLYPEKNPQGATAPLTLYLTPGLTELRGSSGDPLGPLAGASRGGYYATNGAFYSVVGQTLYFVDAAWRYFPLGDLIDNLTTPVSMVDNGLVMVLVDGTTNGYAVDLATNTFGQIIDPSWLGATRADYLDTFLIFNQPGTKNFYTSLSNVTYDSLAVNPGRVQAGNISAAGAGYTDGVYPGLALTGGTGNGATAQITVLGGVVTAVVPDNVGFGYSAGDALGANIPSPGTGAGFEYDLIGVFPAALDPLYIAAKTGFPDKISTVIVMHREIWLIGAMKTSEIWYDAGGALFPFQIIPGVFLEQGCLAPYSVAKYDLGVFFLGIDAAGVATVYQGAGYKNTPISTYAIAQEFSKYTTLSDAIGFVYKQQDHAFYVLTFPTANKTWVYDITQGWWHERTWTDADGGENRIRANWISQAYGKIVCGDWETGALYQLDLTNYTDNSSPIVRRKGFSHLVNDGKRVTYDNFKADMQCGDASLAVKVEDTKVFLRWSDDRGKTYGTPVPQTLGSTGAYLVQPQWNQLGMARDRVFELFWSVPADTALQGGYINVTPAGT